MKIVLVNYRYFFSGGPERYLFNIKQILEEHGHQVIPYSIQHNLNVESEYEQDFLSPIGSGDEVYFTKDFFVYPCQSLHHLRLQIGDPSPLIHRFAVPLPHEGEGL